MTPARLLFAAVLIVFGVSSTSAQITDERSLSKPHYGAAPGDQLTPVVATDGTDFLVAWIDGRALPLTIYANRVTRDGHVLDGTGIRIPMDATNVNEKLVGVFYVEGAYTLIDSYQFSPTSYRTAATRISLDGRIIDGPHIILENEWATAGASNGSHIVLLAANEVVTLDASGQVLAHFALPPYPSYGTGIGSNGSSFLVGTFSYDGAGNSVNLIALDESGKPTDVTRIAASASGDGPVIGSDGADYLVLYVDNRKFKTVAQLVSDHAQIRSTTVLDEVPVSVGRGSVLWTGKSYLAAGSVDQDQMQLFSLNRSGSAIGPPRPLGDGTPGTVNIAAMAWNGSEALITWTTGSQDSAVNGWEIVGALTNADATSISTGTPIPQASELQVAPVIATSGNQDLAVWSEPTGIYATRLLQDGTALDRITVSTETSPSRSLTFSGSSLLRVVYDRGSYLVVWDRAGGVMAQRVDTSGALVGSPMSLAGCSRSFDLANDDDSPVLFDVNCMDGRLYAQRVGLAGAVGPAVPISPTDELTDAPRASWNGNEWLVVWNKLVPAPVLVSPPQYRASSVLAARLTGNLTPLDTQPLVIADSEFYEYSPIVASDGREFLVAWSHTAYDATDGIYLRRVQPDGAISDRAVVVSGAVTAQSIVRSGARYAIGYSRNTGLWDNDLFLTHVSSRADDALIHDEVAISATSSDERSISLLAPPGRPLRIVFTRVATEPAYGGVSRVFMRDVVDTPRRRSVRQR